MNSAGQIGNGLAGFFASSQTVLTVTCGPFWDLPPGSAFCPSVEWMRNRAVTVGCALGQYCPDDDASRLAMAAFLNRLGTSLSPTVREGRSASGAIDRDTGSVVCVTDELPSSTYARRAYLNAVLSATGTADFAVQVVLVASSDGGASWNPLNVNAMRGSVSSGRWTNVAALAHLDIEPGAAMRFGVRIGRESQPGAGMIADSACKTRARIDNRS